MSGTLGEKLKRFRKDLRFSQAYVAEIVNLHRTTIVAIENGSRKVTAEELKDFSELYRVSLDNLVYNSKASERSEVLLRDFERLSEYDKEEIMGLIKYKLSKQ